MTAKPPPPAAPPSPKTQGRTPRATLVDQVHLADIISGTEGGAERVLLYGTGGIGKSTLAAFLPSPLFLDLNKGTRRLNVSRSPVASWTELRGKLAAFAANPPAGIKSVVIDDASVGERMARDHVVATRTTDKGKVVDSIEGFGWGKGWQFVADEFDGLLADLDRIVALGVHVCIIAHVVPSPVPNPNGEDFLRWEPLLYSGDKKGRGSVRDAIKNWSDHTLFIAYDVHVAEGSNKGTGQGTRTIYAVELPTHMAKTRSSVRQLDYDLSDPSAIWRELGISS